MSHALAFLAGMALAALGLSALSHWADEREARFKEVPEWAKG